jgi:hypothetical protein
MYLGIFIIQLIIYILKLIKIENFIKNNEYEKGLNPVILKTATTVEKNTKDILVPDTSTLKIFKSSFL